MSFQEIDGKTCTNTELIVPIEVADKLIANALDWKKNWHGRVKEVEEYLAEIKKVKNNDI